MKDVAGAKDSIEIKVRRGNGTEEIISDNRLEDLVEELRRIRSLLEEIYKRI